MRVAALNFEQISPSVPFFTRDRNEMLNSLDRPSEEPTGYLDTNKGRVRIEFLTASNELAEDTQLSRCYIGPGIYILNYYKPGNDIPVWVVEEAGKLSVSRASEILETTKLIIENKDLKPGDSWTLEGKKHRTLNLPDPRTQYPFTARYTLN